MKVPFENNKKGTGYTVPFCIKCYQLFFLECAYNHLFNPESGYITSYAIPFTSMIYFTNVLERGKYGL